MEEAIVRCASPSPHGEIVLLVEGDDMQKFSYQGNFSCRDENLTKVHHSLREASQWLVKMDSASLCGKFRSGLTNKADLSTVERVPRQHSFFVVWVC